MGAVIARIRCRLNYADANQAGASPGGDYYPQPPPGSEVFDAPGTFSWTPDSGIVLLVVEQWGAGGIGQDGGSETLGGAGGGGGAYAKYSLGAPLFLSGGSVEVVVGAGGAEGGGPSGPSAVYVTGSFGVLAESGGGQSGGAGGAGGANAILPGSGLVVVSATGGSPGDPPTGKNGGAGGSSPNGGAGGAGGVFPNLGEPGDAPGGGGGGGGFGGFGGGVGADGKVVISWG